MSLTNHDAIASGVEAVLAPTVVETAPALTSLHESQVSLASELDRLKTQLTTYLANTQEIDHDVFHKKLEEGKKRLLAVSATLAQVEVRMINVKKEYIKTRSNRSQTRV